MDTADSWNEQTRQTLKRYDEALLRQVAHKLCKPRNQWPVDEILERIVAALTNAAIIDRKLKELPAACRQILAVMGRSRQVRWPVGTLVEILVMLGAEDGLAPLVTLLESGLLLPELFPPGGEAEDGKAGRGRFRNFTSWLARSEPMPVVVATPAVTGRALGEKLGLECPQAEVPAKASVQEADGLDWPLKLAALWQQALATPFRRTQQGDFFKRDADRLSGDPLLSAAPTDALAPVPGPGFLAAALAAACGLLRDQKAEWHAGDWPTAMCGPLPAAIAELWPALGRVTTWNPSAGHVILEGAGNPYPSAYLVAILLLAELPENAWAAPEAIEDYIARRHPYWLGKKTDVGVAAFLLGLAYSLRLVQAAKGEDGAWRLRLSPLGRWLIGSAPQAPAFPAFPQTLLVQPNLEILAYRQGLNPELIAALSKIATWKTLGPACTLQLEPGSVYRALEMGESLGSIVQLLERHGMKAIPPAVLDSLKTWASKRERISVYSAGAIFEFGSAAEMNDAIARGLKATRLTDRLAIVANESDIDYKHFRLTGTRDYTLPAEKCVEVDADGVTLNVDLARSDLLLETEVQRFAEPVATTVPGRRTYRMTPASVAAARQQGVSLAYLESWFGQRTGLPISAAAQLLVAGPDAAPIELRRRLVLQVANEHLADGLAQWPGTRGLILARLGPTTLVIDESSVAALTERTRELGLNMTFEA